jgi:hypothetical protein
MKIPFIFAIQGLYYLLSGLWPLLHLDSFIAITGPKTDLWMVYLLDTLIEVILLLFWIMALYRKKKSNV